MSFFISEKNFHINALFIWKKFLLKIGFIDVSISSEINFNFNIIKRSQT